MKKHRTPLDWIEGIDFRYCKLCGTRFEIGVDCNKHKSFCSTKCGQRYNTFYRSTIYKSKRKMKQRQFILDTLLPYKTDPTKCAWNETFRTCEYMSSDGRRCGIGQHLVDGKHLRFVGGIDSLNEVYGLDNILTKEARNQNFSIEVWRKIQLYHDTIIFINLPSWKSDITREDEINTIVKDLEELVEIELPELKF